MVFNAVAGTDVVTIKAATALDHGTDTGWNSSYATSSTPATFSRSTNGITIDLRLSYLTIDGTLDGASTYPNTSARGIIIENTCTTGSGNVLVYNTNGTTASHVTFKNVQFNGVNNESVDGGDVFFNNATSTDLLIQYCYFNEGSQWWIKTRDVVNQTFEYNYFKNCGSGNADLHSAGIIPDATQGINCIVRYNIFENMLPATGSSAYIEPQNNGHTGTPAELYIYGNVFWASSASESYSPGLVALTGGDSFGTMLFYHNTIYGSHGANPGVFGTENATGWISKNNLWQSCDNDPEFPSVTASDNLLNTGAATFRDAGSGNFDLALNTDAGVVLGSPYDTDMYGRTRTTPSLGAYEYRLRHGGGAAGGAFNF